MGYWPIQVPRHVVSAVPEAALVGRPFARTSPNRIRRSKPSLQPAMTSARSPGVFTMTATALFRLTTILAWHSPSRRTQEVLAQASTSPIFEATFQRDGLLIRADISCCGEMAAPRLIEVKSSTVDET